MEVGQKIQVTNGGRGKHKPRTGTITVVERKFIVVQFENYRSAYQIADVVYNIERKFRILDGGRNESTKEAG
jgi:uncharacterized protein Veg